MNQVCLFLSVLFTFSMAGCHNGRNAKSKTPVSPGKIVGELILSHPDLNSTVAGEAFEATVEVWTPVADGWTKQYETWLGFDGKNASFVTMSPEGLPFVYATTGFSIRIDLNKPGQAIVTRRGVPTIQFGIEDGNFEWSVSHTTSISSQRIECDLTSLLHDAEESGDFVDGKLPLKKGGLRLIALIKASTPSSDLPRLQGITIEKSGAVRIVVRNIERGDACSSAWPTTVRPESIASLRIPTLDVTNEKPLQYDAFPPEGFEKSSEIRKASAELRRFLQSQLAGTKKGSLLIMLQGAMATPSNPADPHERRSAWPCRPATGVEDMATLTPLFQLKARPPRGHGTPLTCHPPRTLLRTFTFSRECR